MLGPNVFVIQPLRLFRAIGKDPLAFVAQRQVDGSRDLFTDRGVGFDLLPDGLNCGVGAEKPVRQSLILAEKPEEQVFSLDVRAAELAGLITGKENYSSR